MTHRKQHMLGLSMVLLATVFFSMKAILVKFAYQYGVDTVTLVTLRMGLALPFYIVMGCWVRRTQTLPALKTNDLLITVGIGLSGYYLASLFDLWGLNYISAGFERLILYLYPMIVLLLSVVWFRRPIRPIEFIALAIGYAGIALIYLQDSASQGPDVRLGVMLVMASAVAYAIFLVGSGQLVAKVGSMRFTVLAMIAACLTMILHFIIARSVSDLIQPQPVYIIGIALALFCTVIPSFLMNAGIKHLGAQEASIVGAVGPVITTLFGVAFLGENMTLWHAAGLILVIGAVTLVTRSNAATKSK